MKNFKPQSHKDKVEFENVVKRHVASGFKEKSLGLLGNLAHGGFTQQCLVFRNITSRYD